MSYLILIRGPAGVGKTTIAKLLAKELSTECIHIDKVLKKHGLEYIKDEKWVPPENFLKVNGIIESDTKKKLKGGKIVIIEGNFYQKEVIEDILKKIKCEHYFFDLKADVKECIERDKTRKSIGPDSIKAVHDLVSEFEHGQLIDTAGKTAKEVIKEIISYLP